MKLFINYLVIFVFLLAGIVKADSIILTGKKNIYLAGQPDGVKIYNEGTEYRYDSSPQHSPILVKSSLTNNQIIQFTNIIGIPGTDVCGNPDGYTIGEPMEYTPYTREIFPTLGLSGIISPLTSILGVFLSDEIPDQTVEKEMLIFFEIEDLDFEVLRPKLEQVFFIGDGKTSDNKIQKFVAPNGATRLFIGVEDCLGCSNNNGGQFEIDFSVSETLNSLVGQIVTSSKILGYTASVGGATIKAVPFNLSTVTDIYGNFELTNIPLGECIIQVESSYFQTLTKSIIVNNGENVVEALEIFKPKCQNMFTQQEVDQLLHQVQSEKDAIISEKEATITQLNTSIASMYTQGYLDKAIIEAEKRGELKYDINNDGKVGLEEIIKYLETISGVRVESLIIFPKEKKYFISE